MRILAEEKLPPLLRMQEASKRSAELRTIIQAVLSELTDRQPTIDLSPVLTAIRALPQVRHLDALTKVSPPVPAQPVAPKRWAFDIERDDDGLITTVHARPVV